MKTITIIGRRWFQRTTGNTYHTAEIIVDGQYVEGVPYRSGSGDCYLHNAFAKLEDLGLVTDRIHRGSAVPPEAPWRWAERKGVRLTSTHADVARKKDL